MEAEIKKHLRSIRILVALSLLIACLSVGYSYILFKEVSVPLQQLRSKELNLMQAQMDYVLATLKKGRAQDKRQTGLEAMQEEGAIESEPINAGAAKAVEETRKPLNPLQKKKRNEATRRLRLLRRWSLHIAT